ncbi:MAG: hypothetical protein M3R51_00555 [Candidatus Eremiobacteraeota bacterium]|nr:hypothetical protein [Candidatus Eremiobacteraeota bacterium]
MRRLSGVFLLCSSLAFIAAVPAVPSPSPKPIPLPAITATPISSGTPSVLIYPFDTPKDLNPKSGEGIASIFAQIFTDSGDVRVLPLGKGVPRANFQKYAIAQHADYYIAGYIQPIGTSAAVVAQLVTVDTGTSAFAQTTEINSVQDVASEALTFHSVLQSLDARNHPELQAQSKATPEPQSTNGASVKLGGLSGAVSSLFKGRTKNGTLPTPTPTPFVKPGRGAIVARISGNVSAGDVTAGTTALLSAMGAHFKTRLATLAPSNVAKATDAICGTDRDNTVASGTLILRQEAGRFGSHSVYDFTLNVYTCFGAPLYTATESDRNFAKAIDDAVSAYAKDHADNS